MKRKIKTIFAVFMILFIVSSFIQPMITSANMQGTLSIDSHSLPYALPNDLPAPFAGRSDNYFYQMTMVTNGERQTAYCIEFGVPTTGGSIYGSTDNYNKIDEATRQKINYVLMIGYNVKKGTQYVHNNATLEYIATQILVWNVMYNVYGTNSETRIIDSYSQSNARLKEVYNAIRSEYASVDVLPSFASKEAGNANTYNLMYNRNSGRFETTLTDANNVINNFNYASPNANFSANGNTLHITATTNGNNGDLGQVTVTRNFNLPNSKFLTGVNRYWQSGNLQDLVSINVDVNPNSLNGYFNIQIDHGNLELVKTSEDGVVDGFQFRITGNGIDQTVTTANGGRFFIENLIAGTYTITEVNTPNRYVEPESQQVTLQQGQTTEVTFTNIIKKGNVEILKYSAPGEDGELNRLANAEFTISNNEYSTPMSYTLLTDENGFLKFEDLWYGTWLLEETGPPEGHMAIPPRYVVVDEHGRTYTYSFSDDPIAQIVKITKIDAESRLPILIENTGFKIRDLDTGEFISQNIMYPTPTTLEEFFTNADGFLVLPEKLPYNTNGYELVETVAPDGYTLNETPLHFTITNDSEIIEIEMANDPQKGTLSVFKHGEVLTGWEPFETDKGTIYKPIYEEKGLEGAVFDIIAREDIITGDGMKHYSQGDVVETITTDAEGNATSSPLPLGEYQVVEIDIPGDYIIDSEPVFVSLIYQGQHIEVFNESLDIFNKRQRVGIRFTKLMEVNDLHNIGNQGEFKHVIFGLYAKNDIMFGEEVAVEADALISYAKVFINNQVLFFVDLPVTSQATEYYIKEMQTDDKYILDETEYPVIIQFDSSEEELILVEINNNEPIINELKYGEVLIEKSDITDGKLLPNTGIEILDENKNVLISGRTDDKGIIRFEKLPVGNYYYREFDAPEGYLIDESPYPFEVTENGEIIKINMTNERIPESLEAATTAEVTRTNDNLNPGIYASLVITSLLYIGLIKWKKKNV